MTQTTVIKSSATPEPRTTPSLQTPAPTAGVKRKRVADQKFYAVKQGKRPGIYQTWQECLGQVKGQKGALFKAFPSLHEAQAFIDGKQLTQTSPRASGEQKFYAVQNGKVPGVYTDWASAQSQIRGIRKPRHKKFSTRADAEAFVAAGRKEIYDSVSALTSEEEIRRIIVQNSAPGLVTNGLYAPKDKEGREYPPGLGPLPPGAEDGFDPNISLAADGTIVRRDEDEKIRTKMVRKEKEFPGMLRIYTDGSSLKNGQAGARAGVGVFFGPQNPMNISEALRGTKQTNQRAELTAILRALDIAPRHRDVTIYTDSKYAISCVTDWYKSWMKNKWTNSKGKPVENKDLIVDIREKIEERDYVKRGTFFVWVKGHANDAGNIEADRLAVEGARNGRDMTPEVERGEELERARSAEESVGGSHVVTGEEDGEVTDAFRAMEQAMVESQDEEIK